MRREQLIRLIANSTGEKQATVKAVLDAFQNITAESLSNGESVALHGFGTFEIKSRSPRIGRNPHTGDPVEIPARVLPGFTPSDILKERISGKPNNINSASKSLRDSPSKR